ncbi:MAG: hypothetical protein JRI68_02545 [Deltaproteobacteria bacterium]|nr:hypothetical protein [Deltaproteobacteria bacterium]
MNDIIGGGGKRGRSKWVPRVLLVALIGIIGAVVVYAKTLVLPPESAAAIQARLELAAGEVWIDQGGGEEPAISQTPLMASAKVRTGAGARALVRLPDGSAAFLRGGTSLALGEEEVTLGEGEYWLDAPAIERNALVHRLGDVGVAAVDAGLSLKRQGDVVEVYVARGLAVITAKGGRVEVNAGELMTVTGATEPKVEPLAFWDDWTGGMADFGGAVATVAAGNGEIFAVDRGGPSGRPAERLQIKSQSVRAIIRHGLSETEVDQTFFNPSTRPVEGWYWFSVPEGASVTGFAVETNGQLIEGEFIERKEAAKKYGVAKRSGHAPAILEWIDHSTYRARIFPILPSGSRRIVLRYIELRPVVDGTLTYVYPMAGRTPMRIGELSLTVDLGDAGKRMEIATLAEARVEDGGRRVTMRRSGYTPRVDFQLEAQRPLKRNNLTVTRYQTDGEAADYVMARYTPDVDWNKAQGGQADVVVAVDTSAAGDEGSRQLKASVAEALLRALSTEDRFALVALDVRSKVLYPQKGLAQATGKEIAAALEALSDHAAGGATDMASLFDVALGRVHDSQQPAVVYVGDGIATSGELTGEQLIERLRRALSTSRARLFTVAVGAEADQALLGELARTGGGKLSSVSDARRATSEALQLTAAIKVPTLTDFELDLGAGLDEPFVNVSGKVSRGTEVVLLARTHHEIPKLVRVRGKLGGQDIDQEVQVVKDKSVVAAFVPRLWAAEYVRRLLGAASGPEAQRGRVAELGIDYGLMTPFTSILALESEAAYRNMGIKRQRSPLRGVRLSALDDTKERRLRGVLHSAPPSAPFAYGCAKAAPEAEPSVATAAEEVDRTVAETDNKEGGLGTRAKGEEGSMGNPNSRLTGNRYGVAGPVDTPTEELDGLPPEDPQLPRQARLREAGEFGKIGLLNTGAGGVSRGGGGKADRVATPAPPAAKVAARPTQAEGQSGKERSEPVLYRRGPPQASVRLGTCSADARRPLAQRARVWRKRLRTITSEGELVFRHRAAIRACELTDWRSERTFLDLMQRHITSEAGTNIVLRHFATRPEVQRFIAKLILRRAVDPRVIAAVEKALFGGAVDWAKVDRELTELPDVEARIDKLREVMAQAPEDPNGIIRLVSLLAQAGKSDEALAMGRRLRERGLMTLDVARQLGDVLARASLADEAVRTYSEIVEFDPHSTASRRLLGDIYLAHGWHGQAYRQYKTIVEAAPADSLGWLRLANAAAGAGRIDEALRIDRRVASAQGRPGPDDPRRWARLWSAVRLASLLEKPPAGTSPAALQRKLKELGLFRGAGTLILVTWQDLNSDVALVTSADEQPVALGESTDAAPVGMAATLLSPADVARSELSAHLRSLPRLDPLALWRHDLQWDGKTFTVRRKRVDLPAGRRRQPYSGGWLDKEPSARARST